MFQFIWRVFSLLLNSWNLRLNNVCIVFLLIINEILEGCGIWCSEIESNKEYFIKKWLKEVVFHNIVIQWSYLLSWRSDGTLGPGESLRRGQKMLRTFHLKNERKIKCQTTCSSPTWAPGLPCCPGGPGSPWGPWRKQVHFINLITNTKIDYFIYLSRTSQVKVRVISCSIWSIKSEMLLSTDINQKLIPKQANSTTSCSGSR